FFFQAEDGIRDFHVTGVQTCALPICVWLTHCPGIVAMARNNEPDTGSTDFYIVIGQAPRYLDRNLTIFGRVIDGMEVVQRIHRGDRKSVVEGKGVDVGGSPMHEKDNR